MVINNSKVLLGLEFPLFTKKKHTLMGLIFDRIVKCFLRGNKWLVLIYLALI